jgi:hypothetical protein
VNLAIASHALQSFWVNAEQLRCFIAVQEWLEDKFISRSGLARRRSEPRWLGRGDMGRFAWDFGHSGTPDKRQSGGDTLGIFLVGREVGFQELVFNPSSLMDHPRNPAF